MFPNDTKVDRLIKSEKDVSALQDEVDRSYKWAEKWRMKFSVVNCSIPGLGKHNPWQLFFELDFHEQM